MGVVLVTNSNREEWRDPNMGQGSRPPRGGGGCEEEGSDKLGVTLPGQGQLAQMGFRPG